MPLKVKMIQQVGCALLLALFILSCACGESEPIKIGFVAGLSGRRSQLGVSARNGVQLAIDRINTSGGVNGRKIELIIKDDQSDVATCARALNELIDSGVVSIIGPLLSKMVDAVLETANTRGVLVISPTISTDSVKDLDDNFLRVMPVASSEARTIGQKIIKDGHGRIAVVYDSSNNAYTQPIFMKLKEILEGQGKTIPYINSLASGRSSQFSRIAKEIIDSKPDALFLTTSGIDASFLFQQIRKIDAGIQFYGGQWVKTGNIIEEGGKAVEGLTVVAPYERDTKSDAYLTFQRRYRQMFRKDPGFVSVYAYEATYVLLAGIQQSKNPSPMQIKMAILGIKTFEGLEETFTINEYGDAFRKNQLLVVENGKFENASNQ